MEMITRRNILGLIVIVFVAIGVIFTVQLVQKQTQLKSKASGQCRSNPDGAPEGFTWEAKCSDSECASADDCASRYGVSAANAWCYGFDEGSRCMVLVENGSGSSGGGAQCTPSEWDGSRCRRCNGGTWGSDGSDWSDNPGSWCNCAREYSVTTQNKQYTAEQYPSCCTAEGVITKPSGCTPSGNGTGSGGSGGSGDATVTGDFTAAVLPEADDAGGSVAHLVRGNPERWQKIKFNWNLSDTSRNDVKFFVNTIGSCSSCNPSDNVWSQISGVSSSSNGEFIWQPPINMSFTKHTIALMIGSGSYTVVKIQDITFDENRIGAPAGGSGGTGGNNFVTVKGVIKDNTGKALSGKTVKIKTTDQSNQPKEQDFTTGGDGVFTAVGYVPTGAAYAVRPQNTDGFIVSPPTREGDNCGENCNFTFTPISAGGTDVADCEVVTIEGQALRDFPGLVINKQYRVNIIMKNTRISNVTTNPWKSDYRIKFLGGPVAQEKLGITDTEFILGKEVSVGDQFPFNLLIKPISVGTYPFKWQLYNSENLPIGGQCSPDFKVFAVLPGTPTPAPGGTPPPGSTPAPASDTVQFRVADGNKEEDALANLDLLAESAWKNYSPTANSKFMLTNFTLNAPQTGKLKYVAVQFRKGSVLSEPVVKSIKYIGASPVISNIACEYTASGEQTKVTIKGENLGQPGSVKNGQNLAETIDSWEPTQIVVRFEDKLQGKFKVKVTTSEGQEASEKDCTVGVTSVKFSVTTLCTPDYSADNVDVKIFENSPNSDPSKPLFSQKIRVTGREPQSFDPRIEPNKNYSILVKGPKSLAVRRDFKAEKGTKTLDEPIILPIGDIAPVAAPNGKINSEDVSELYREWSVLRSTSSAGDLNGDGKVNAIDYSCMKQSVNASKGNDTFKPPVAPIPTPAPSPSAGPVI